MRLLGKKFTFGHGLAVSLLLHTFFLGLPFVLAALPPVEQVGHEKLRVELYGMISSRQQEERHAAAEEPPPPTQTAPRPVKAQYQAESPVQAPKEEQTAPQPPVPKTASAAEEQKQQTIKPDETANRLREYMAKVTKQIQGQLVYPKEVKENGVGGVITIAFTITPSGEIRDGSLRVRKSSGYAALDASAMKAARAAAPFEAPPFEIDVVIGVVFER